VHAYDRTMNHHPQAIVGRARYNPPPASGRWGLAHTLALVGALISLYLVWTFTQPRIPRRPRAGQHRVRGPRRVSWWAARVFETIYVLMSIGVLTFVVRAAGGRNGSPSDGMFLVAGFATLGLDPLVNFFGPFSCTARTGVNLNTWCGTRPLYRQSPDCSRCRSRSAIC